ARAGKLLPYPPAALIPQLLVDVEHVPAVPGRAQVAEQHRQARFGLRAEHELRPAHFHRGRDEHQLAHDPAEDREVFEHQRSHTDYARSAPDYENPELVPEAEVLPPLPQVIEGLEDVRI